MKVLLDFVYSIVWRVASLYYIHLTSSSWVLYYPFRLDFALRDLITIAALTAALSSEYDTLTSLDVLNVQKLKVANLQRQLDSLNRVDLTPGLVQTAASYTDSLFNFTDPQSGITLDRKQQIPSPNFVNLSNTYLKVSNFKTQSPGTVLYFAVVIPPYGKLNNSRINLANYTEYAYEEMLAIPANNY